MKKKKKSSGLVYSPEAVKATKKALKEFNWKRLLVILGATVGAFALLEGVIAIEANARLGYSIILPIYYIVTTLVGAAVIFLNHGFGREDFTPEKLREDVPAEEAEQICKKLNEHKSLARKLMYVLIPLVMAILLDFMYLFYGDALASIVKLLVPS